MKEAKFNSLFEKAIRVSTPLIAVRTPDPAATMKTISEIAEKVNDNKNTPLVTWDTVRGFTGYSQAGVQAISQVCSGGVLPNMITNAIEALATAHALPEDSILFFLNAQRLIKENAVIQGIWNLRDAFKSNSRTLVMLGVSMQLPNELLNDVAIIDEPLPTLGELSQIARDCFENAKLPKPAGKVVDQLTDATCGLAAFAADQAISLNITKAGVNVDGVWERKRQSIEQLKGLSVWRGTQTFDDIGGCENAKNFMRAVIEGNDAPRCIVFWDEIEKSVQQDLGSSANAEMLGTVLTWMQDNNATGVIKVGPPGAAKSETAKATGNTAGIPTIAFDPSGMKGSLQGETGDNLRAALKVIEAVSQGRAMFIATCNSIASLPPELRRRFNFGTFFYDLPTAEERNAIWQIWMKKFNIDTTMARPKDNEWTGSEIRQCCMLAYRLKRKLTEVANFIVPVALSAADQIERLRTQASGKFISASYPGLYVYNKQAAAPSAPRAMKVSD